MNKCSHISRDWYDFEWYIKRGTDLNLEHLKERMVDSGNFEESDELTQDILKDLLIEKIQTLDIEKAKDDVKVFIKDQSVLDFWSKEYFILLANKVAS